MKEFKKLLIEYKTIIDLAYDKGSSRDYTADYMTYDFRGFIEVIEPTLDDGWEFPSDLDDQIKKYMPQLKEAVKHARKYKKWLTSEYKYTFG